MFVVGSKLDILNFGVDLVDGLKHFESFLL